jgi:predicted nucleic acid-binding Zn ribbon protein
VLGSVIKRHGLEKKFAEYEFITRWREVVGDEISQVAKPEVIRNGVLFVKVPNSAWAQELSFRQSLIIKRLEEVTGAMKVIRSIRFVVEDKRSQQISSYHRAY